MTVVHLALREQSLRVGRSWALLSSAWPQSGSAVVGPEASLPSLVSFATRAHVLASS